MRMKASALLTVHGTVQGVGFRPFAARTAEEMGLPGYVKNKGGFVEILLSAEPEAVDEYIHRLCANKPFGADIRHIERKESKQWREGKFAIEESEPYAETPVLPPDFSVCEDCLKEMTDPRNRRYRHPFISCTACGPRYSVIREIPYDRDHTTMDIFQMCGGCETEYTGQTRRRHAQTIACHDCGPQLIWKDRDSRKLTREDALREAASAVKKGGIIAVKGIGGYQYVCTPYREETVRALRRLKGREKKPFAVMFPGIEAIRRVCFLSLKEKKLLESSAKPIVLLEKKREAFAPGVCGDSRFAGAFLPYSPLHVLLTEECGELIVTSANPSGEMLYYREEQIFSEESKLLDGVLYHQREIVTPLDDSVMKVSGGRMQTIRRSRGYVPVPFEVPSAASGEFLAAGADLKASFSLVKNGLVFPSQYFGDMESLSVQKAYQETFDHMKTLFHIQPRAVACDLHPAYHTVRLAEQSGLPLIRIQHHHAHIASVMAEHGLRGKVIGAAFDGTGYGTDGTVWGGEILLCQGAECKRIGGLKPILIGGGDRAAKEIRLSAFSHLYAAGLPGKGQEFDWFRAAVENHLNTAVSSSMGRLFDAVSYLLGLARRNDYEGSAAIALENAAVRAERAELAPHRLRFPLDSDGFADRLPVIRELAGAFRSGVPAEQLALGFHHAVADLILETCILFQSETKQVALSGGTFANGLLCQLAEEKLRKSGFCVYFNERVPCNDGGISLGQAYICGAQ